MAKQDAHFISDNLSIHGILDQSPSATKGLLFFHGGGNSNAERYSKVQTYFSDHGITSFVFSFRGCGHSEGDITKSTMLDRLTDAKNALETFKSLTGFSENQIFLWGSSMGGHIAARLVANYPTIKGLILQSAAAYGQHAESQTFGPNFKDTINQKDNWNESLAFQDLSTYPNPTLIIYGEYDDVIPKKVQDTFLSSAQFPHHFTLTGYGHSMIRPSTETEHKAWQEMLDLSNNFIKSI